MIQFESKLFEIRHWDGPPQVVGEMADQQLVDEVDRPEDPVDEQQEPTMVIMPADHQRVETKDKIDDAMFSFHICKNRLLLR
jgi:hypothetical protein